MVRIHINDNIAAADEINYRRHLLIHIFPSPQVTRINKCRVNVIAFRHEELKKR